MSSINEFEREDLEGLMPAATGSVDSLEATCGEQQELADSCPHDA